MSFYTAMKHHNVVPSLQSALDNCDLLDELGDAEIFHAKHCSPMKDHYSMKRLVREWYDTYKDLDKVIASKYC